MIQAYDGDKYSTQETGHGRTETRLAIVNHNLSILGDTVFEWSNLTTMGVVAVIRQEGDEATESISVRFYISSTKLSYLNRLGHFSQ